MTASGETVNDIATVHVVKDKVTLTFNQNVTKLPNGFKGSFTFYAEAQRAANQDNQNVETTTINVGGHLITIHIRPHATSGSSGIKPNPEPVDVPKDALSKVGWTGKSGMINWQLNGAVTSKATGTITITDTPNSEYKSTIIPSSFQLFVKKVGQKSRVYSYNELVKDGYLHLDANTGQWVLKLPATMLQNSHWGVYYQAKPDLLLDGQEYHNSASMTVNQNQIDQRAVIHVKNMGSGDITGNDSSSSSSIVIPSTTNSSAETTTKPTESTSTAVKPSTTNSSTETTTKPTSTRSTVTMITSTTNFGGGNGGTTTTTTGTMNGPVVNNQYNSKSNHQSSAKELLPQTGAKRLTTIWTYVGVVLVIAAIIIAIIKYRNTR